jgi:hypothetical protein
MLCYYIGSASACAEKKEEEAGGGDETKTTRDPQRAKREDPNGKST